MRPDALGESPMQFRPMQIRLVSLVVGCLIAAMSSATAQTQFPQMERFIVVLTDDAGNPSLAANDIALSVRGRIGYIFGTQDRRALRGFSLSMPGALLESLRRDSRVDYIERDLPVTINDQTIPSGINRIFASSNPNLGIDGVDDKRVDVDIAIVDTGIDYEHPDLNVVGGIDCTYRTGGFFFSSNYCEEDANGDDDHYHGTHVAGIAAAIDNGQGVVGVAPGARLWAVKVLDATGSGFTSGVIAGLDWVVAQGDIEVINLSLGGSGVSRAYEDAINNAVANGVVVVVAAGNDSDDASSYSPAFVESAITVSALADFDGLPGGSGLTSCGVDQDDTLASFSNYGSIIDITAPGFCIYSTMPIELGSYALLSGTSMAAPHVAGAAGLLASGSGAPDNASDVQAIAQTLSIYGNYNWTDDSGDGIQEALLDVGTFSAEFGMPGENDDDEEENPPANESPNAQFSYSCEELTCSFTDQSSDDLGIVSRSWAFGDGNTSSSQNPNHSFADNGQYTVTLTVTDTDGEADQTSQTVEVEAAEMEDTSIVLSTSISRQTSRTTYISLNWSGANSRRVDVYRNGSRVKTTGNDGNVSDRIRDNRGSELTYQICEAGTANCSNVSNISI